MPTFDLSKAVPELRYNFGGGVAGVVPEPSPQAVNRFRVRMAENIKVTGKDVGDLTSADELLRVLSSLSEDDLNLIYEENLDALAELCAGSPTREQLAALGHRAFQAFLGWIMGELSSPEGSRPATKR